VIGKIHVSANENIPGFGGMISL